MRSARRPERDLGRVHPNHAVLNEGRRSVEATRCLHETAPSESYPASSSARTNRIRFSPSSPQAARIPPSERGGHLDDIDQEPVR